MTRLFQTRIFLLLLAATLLGSAPAWAGDVEARLDRLEKSLAENPDDFRVYWKNGLRFDSNDRLFRYRLGGRLQNDWARFDAGEDLKSKFGDQPGGGEFRRAELFISGLLYNRVQFKAQYDFAGGETRMKDVFIGILGLPVVGNVLIGHFIEPILLETHTSNKFLTFLERSLLYETFAPDRNMGVAIYDQALGDRLFWSLGWFKETSANPPVAVAEGNNAVSLRLAGLPWYERGGRRLLHLGASYSYRDPPEDTARFRTRPEAHLVDARFVDTGPLAAESVQLLGLEAASVLGPLSLQAEQMTAWMDGGPGGQARFDGYYIQAGWFLTGEHRPYLAGAFSRVIPRRNFLERGGFGAWQLALRYSQVDLDDPEAGILGGFEENVSVALNAYLNPQTRVMFNYVRANPSTANDGLDVWQVRVQVEF